MHLCQSNSFRSSPNWEQTVLLAILDRDGLLAATPKRSRDQLLGCGQIRMVAAGEAIQHQGDPAKGLFCVVSGQIRVTILDAAGAEILLYIAHSGFWLGEAPIIDSGVTVVAARAAVDAAIFVIPAAAVQPMMRSDPEIALFLARLALLHSRLSVRRVLENATLPASALIARMLFHQYSEARRGGTDNAAQNIMLTQDELSTMCGLSRKTVSRALQTLKQSDIIATEYSSIRIKDIAGLGRAAHVSG